MGAQENEPLETTGPAAEATAGNANRPAAAREGGWLSTTGALVFGLVLWGGLIVLVASIWSEGAARLRREYWMQTLALGAGSLLFMLLGQAIEQRLARQSAANRRLAAVFLAVPLLAVAIVAIGVLASDDARLALQVVFILVTSLLPAGVYYLFLNMRRASILNEFVANLGRLGLLRAFDSRETGMPCESGQARHARIAGYLQRFEAAYGKLRFDAGSHAPLDRDDFVRSLMASAAKADEAAAPERPNALPTTGVLLADMFRANLLIPLALVTLLSTLGWLLVLQPVWEARVEDRAVTVQDAGESDRKQAAALQENTRKNDGEVVTTADNAAGKDADGADDPATTGNPSELRLVPYWTPLNFAFLGAWFFGVQTIFRRFARRDLSPNAYLSFATRLLLATIGAWVLVAAWNVLADQQLNPWNTQVWPAGLLVLAFVVGVFPRVLWQMLGTALARLPMVDVAIPGLQSRLPLADLDGLTVWHEARLEEEDIENVPNMATADLVDLMLHTQIPADRLVSWVDQAILYTVLGADDEDRGRGRRERLRRLGLRNATQVVHAWQRTGALADGQPPSCSRAELEGALNKGEAGGPLPFIVESLKVETNFVAVSAWRNL